MAKEALKPFMIALLISMSMVVYITECVHVSTWQSCATIPNSSRTLYEVSLDACADECVNRPYCGVLRYWRQRKKCDMVDSNSSFSYHQSYADMFNRSCIEVQRINIEAQQCNCTDGKICEDGRCLFKECPKPVVANATVNGNMQKIGSKVKIKCTYLVGNANVPAIATCNSTGAWSNLPTCPTQYPDEVVKLGSWIMAVRRQRLKQNKARENCTGDGGNLVRIDTIAKQETIANYLQENTALYSGSSFWIQGKRQSDDTFVFDDGTQVPMNRTVWIDGQPDDHLGNQDCITMVSKSEQSWDDDFCDRMNYQFICEFSIP